MPKFGRRPPKNAPALRLSLLLSGQTPDHPASADYLNLGGWQMLGNDQYGDCVAVTWANERRLLTHQAGAEHYPNLDDTLAFYKTQNPDFPQQDDGMEIQTALEYLNKTGGPDGVKAVAFAKVDHTNLDEVKAACAIFGQLWIGITVTAANETEFDHGQPWDYVARSQTEGGHSIVGGGYDSDNTGGDVKFITWATETSFTDAFWREQVDECWAVIWPEHFTAKPFLTGIDTNQLAAAYQTLTGRQLPVPVTPPPVNPPTGAATFQVSDPVAAAVGRTAARRKMTGDAWLDKHLRHYLNVT